MKLQGKAINCINARPSVIHCDLMVALDDLVQLLYPSSSIVRCAFILINYLKIKIISGNP